MCFYFYFFQILGFVFGAISWLKDLVIGDNAPLRVIQDSVKLLGYVSFHLVIQIFTRNQVLLHSISIKFVCLQNIILVNMLK